MFMRHHLLFAIGSLVRVLVLVVSEEVDLC